MKYILTILFLVCTLVPFGQDTAITYSQVVKIENVTKDDIYKRIKLWSVSAFEKTKGANQLDDKENGLLAYDASASHISPKCTECPKIDPNNTKEIYKNIGYFHDYTFRFKIQIKDGKYKIDVTDIYFIDGSDKYQLTSAIKAPFKIMFMKQSKMDEQWADAKLTFDDFIKSFLLSLSASVSKNDDF